MSSPANVDPSERPTPRLSSAWEMQADFAGELSTRLRERELVLSRTSSTLDTRRASIDLAQKAHEMHEWAPVMSAVVSVLDSERVTP